MKLSIVNQIGQFFFAFIRCWVLKGKYTMIYPINALIWNTPQFVKWYQRVKILLILEFVMEGNLKERSLIPTKKRRWKFWNWTRWSSQIWMQSVINLHKLKKMTISSKMVHIWSPGYTHSYDLNLWRIITFFPIIYFVNDE